MKQPEYDNRKAFAQLPLFLMALCLVMAAVFAWRLVLVNSLFGDPSGCGICLVRAAALSDTPFLLTWLLLAWIGCALGPTTSGRLLRLTSVILLALYATDVYVMGAFFTRLYVTWLLTIGATPAPVLEHLRSSGIAAPAALAAIALLAVVAVVHAPHPRPPLSRPVYVVLGLIVVSSIASSLYQVQYVHAWASQNVFFATQFSGISRPYSQQYRKQLDQSSEPIPECRDGSGTAQDLIVLILESWSAYHSGLWGGTRDWTPELDAIAQDSLRPTRFIAGGFNTNDGLMAIIAGIPLLSPLSSLFARRAFEPAWGWDFTLPKQLKSGGYFTAFLTSGNLGFTNKGTWLTHVGFDYVEGHDHPSYDGMPRSHFKSAPDHALFKRAANYWEAHAGDGQPLALVVESVSSHTPFLHPISKKPGEEAVIRYLDTSVGEFFRGLEDVGYFADGGILVIVSDHRSMTVIGAEERKALGIWAPALVPMVTHGNSIAPRSSDQLAQQADLAPSLARLLTDTGCGFPDWVDLFAKPAQPQPRCVYHSSGTNWEHILAYCTDGFGTVQLNGDQSHFVASDRLSPTEREHILDEVARLRIVTQQQTDQYFSSH